LKFHDHDKLAHYANAAVDIEFEFPFGFKEIEGIHSRTDFDLKAHQELSKKKQQYFDPEINESYIPFVVETSVGADRLFLATLCNAYTEETVGEGENQKQRVYLNLHPAIAPVKVAVLPLVKKDGLAEKAQEICNSLKYAFNTTYDESGAIGKRYTRQDLIGTPYCVVVDYQTMEDQTVTVRDRNSMEQERISIADLKEKLGFAVSMERIFEKLV
jgi:glycyl-tRNA synthetase